MEGKYEFKEVKAVLHEAGLLTLVSDKAENLLNWNPLWDFSETIKYTAEWYRKFEMSNSAYDCCMRDICTFEIKKEK